MTARPPSGAAASWRALMPIALIFTMSFAVPWAGFAPDAAAQDTAEREQQDASDASAGATGDSGTVNGAPRETPAAAPAVTTGPGAPLPPPAVVLPPPAPLPNLDPGVTGGIGGTAQVVFGAVSDTTVFTSAPNAPQSSESAGLLAIGGPQGAVTLISFDVTGIGESTVLAALLTFSGGGEAGAPGGSVGVIEDYIVPEGLTANGVPGGGSALNVHGAPSWFERVEPGGLTAIDVTGSVSGNGAVTFVLPGQPEGTGAILASESGVPPELILTVALPG